MKILLVSSFIVSAILVNSAIADAADYQALSVPMGAYSTTQKKHFDSDTSDTSSGLVSGLRYERRNTQQYGGSLEFVYASAAPNAQSTVERSSIGLNMAAELFVSPVLAVTAGVFFERSNFQGETDAALTKSTVDIWGSHAALTFAVSIGLASTLPFLSRLKMYSSKSILVTAASAIISFVVASREHPFIPKFPIFCHASAWSFNFQRGLS